MVPVVILLYNNLHLSKPCIKSVLAQDVPVYCWAIDTGSTDGTIPWLLTMRDVHFTPLIPFHSVAASWNFALNHLFSEGHDAVLVLNNDTVLRPDTVRHLVNDGGGFVTAVGTDDPEKIKDLSPPDPSKKRPHPDFSCYLIRPEVWEKVGPFNEKFLIAFCEDSEYHCRLHAAGVTAWALELPFLHWGSATIKNADHADQIRISTQADKNKQFFKSLYGFDVGSKEYYDYFGTGSPDSERSINP